MGFRNLIGASERALRRVVAVPGVGSSMIGAPERARR
jgi:hypothetical protein